MNINLSVQSTFVVLLACLELVCGQTCPQTIFRTDTGAEEDFLIRQGTSIEREGIVFTQRFDGNFQIFTGSLGNLECLVFETGQREIDPPIDPTVNFYETFLNNAGRVATNLFDSNDDRQRQIFKTARIQEDVPSTLFWRLGCDDTLAIYNSEEEGAQPLLGSIIETNNCGLVERSDSPSSLPSSDPSPAPSPSPSMSPSDDPSGSPSKAPSASPSSKPSDQPSLRPSAQPTDTPPRTCKRAVVMRENQRVNAGTTLDLRNGAYLEQIQNGNVLIRRGSANTRNPGEILWQSCTEEGRSRDYFTALQGDSQFITYSDCCPLEFVWKRDHFVADITGPWELALECDPAGNDWNRLTITDDSGSNVAWETSLGPSSCEIEDPVCPSAVILLDVDGRLQSDNPEGGTVSVGSGYSLRVTSSGALQLLEGEPSRITCNLPLWEKGPSIPLPDSVTQQSLAVMQLDGNLVMYYKAFAQDDIIDVWSSGTFFQKQSSFYFVLDNCNEQTSVAVYEGDPTTDSDANRLWGEQFVDECKDRPIPRLRT